MQKVLVAPLVIVAALCLMAPATASAQMGSGGAAEVFSWFRWDFSLSASYVAHRNGASLSLSAPGQPTGSVAQLQQQFDLRGIALEGTAQLRGRGPLGIRLGGNYTYYASQPSLETVQVEGSSALSRTWDARPQGGGADGALTYDVNPALATVLGLRYENFQANFISPSSGFGAAVGLLDTATVTINSWAPYVGLVYGRVVGGPGINVHLGILGTPWVLGSIDYLETVESLLSIGGVAVSGIPASNEFVQGYFVEAFANCSVVSIWGMHLGAFAKYQTTRAACNANVGERSYFPQRPVIDVFGNRLPPGIPSVIYKFDFHKQNWSVGGQVGVVF